MGKKQTEHLVQCILRGLRLPPGAGENVGQQVAAHLAGPETVPAVLRALSLLSEGWRTAEAEFRRQVMAHTDEWLAELAAMPEVERLGAALATMRAHGHEMPPCLVELLGELADMAKRELERRGQLVPGAGVH
ncbi:hypothetical protein [Mesorhizobium sp. M0522]|uniref:hypothetical protein n=1 Tax=Mesorhizobium sp. M0522 TaxID=2956958 RepID=UPI00333A5C3D